MPRRTEQYQLALDFSQSESSHATGLEVTNPLFSVTTEIGRFVRESSDAVLVRTPADAVHYLFIQIFRSIEFIDQEELWILLLNTKNIITHEVMLYRGTLDSVQVRPAEVFKEAIRLNSAAILLAHNHPSGDPTPSSHDVQLTELLYKISILLEIDLLDHIVLGNGAWYSLKEHGLGFSPELLPDQTTHQT